MKKLLFLAAVMILSVSAHAEEPSPFAGVFSECVKWTTYNDIPTSKKFQLVYGADNTVVYRILFYDRTDKCEGLPVQGKEYSEFETLKDFGNSAIHFREVKEPNEGFYLQLILSKDSASITRSDNYPIKIQFNNFIVLKRDL